MNDKVSWFIKLWHDNDPAVYGVGECGPLPGLSPDATPEMEATLQQVLANFPTQKISSFTDIRKLVPPAFPAIIFGLETAWLDLYNQGTRTVFDNGFIHGQRLPINGLIWMGDLDFMMHQINEKISKGFRCIKLKVGGLNFERECDIVQYIRQRYYREDITIRLDANGAFKPEEAMDKLQALSRFNIHSIEQPVKPGMAIMETLCRNSPVPVALDEELIGVTSRQEKVQMLQRIKPAYIILKPTLHGGLSGSAEWITVAEELGVGWWITSALESNIGLNAICQFTANYPITLPQGLGTGTIYDNNIISPLVVEQGDIFLNPQGHWDLSDLTWH